MTNTGIPQRDARLIRHKDATHLFAVGQAVRLRGGFGRPALPSETYHITGTIPPHAGSLQYRIRNVRERHERVATQESLEPVGMALSGSEETLIERTFGYGKGTETQQSRDQKTKAGKGSTKT